MKTLYFRDGTPITKSQFLKECPSDWENMTDEFGVFNWGCYTAMYCE